MIGLFLNKNWASEFEWNFKKLLWKYVLNVYFFKSNVILEFVLECHYRTLFSTKCVHILREIFQLINIRLHLMSSKRLFMNFLWLFC